jgi:hypothetical protein
LLINPYHIKGTKMKTIFCAIALACGGSAAWAANTVTIKQAGQDNNASTEQFATVNATATTRQIGYRNSAGDPQNATGGILQQFSSDVTASCEQNGKAQLAAITHFLSSI